MSKQRIVVVGAGISGATIAERYAREKNASVLVIENRGYVGGNCYDFYDSTGILIPLHGPHFFHTNSKHVWEYVSMFTDWTAYEHRVLSYVKKKYVPIPVNITTVNQLFGLRITNKNEMKQWLLKEIMPLHNPQNSEEAALRRVGKRLYELLFKQYTKKQWDMWPHELKPEIMDRIPVRFTTDDRYFTDTYQGMPKGGYTSIFTKMLSHPRITVRLHTNYFNVKDDLSTYDKLIFTGPIDKFFNYCFGKLQYRSVKFKYEKHDKQYFQTGAQINYPNNFKFTRITEPKHATGQKSINTTTIKEYPSWNGELHYPVLSEKNCQMYSRYLKKAQYSKKKGVYFVGRLANFKYYNMDQAFENALNVFNDIS